MDDVVQVILPFFSSFQREMEILYNILSKLQEHFLRAMTFTQKHIGLEYFRASVY